MPAQILDGVALAQQVKMDVALRVVALREKRRVVKLIAVLVGATPAAELFANRQAEACRAVGIDYELKKLSAGATQTELAGVMHKLNEDASVTGIMLHLPLPEHLNATDLQYAIDRWKDVEGVNPANIGYVVYGQRALVPFTAASCVKLVRATGTDLKGAEAVVVGASQIVGKPVALLLMQELATVCVCNVATKDLMLHTQRADILVVAVGKAGLIGPEHVKAGAIVIDVGINRVTQPDGTKKTVGDVQFDAVAEKAGWITPVPGGVGPMTVAILLRNTVRAAELLAGMTAG